MYRGYLVFAILIVRLKGFVLDDVECNYVHSYNCYISSMGHDTAVLSLCSEDEIPEHIKFVLLLDTNNSTYPGILKVGFTPPKVNCKYGVTLLATALINNEMDCSNYRFQDSTDIEARTHTAEKTICAVASGNHRYTHNDNPTAVLCQEDLMLWFQYVFTGCYAIQFHVANNTFAVRGNTFLRTDYNRADVDEPIIHCNYYAEPVIEQSQKTITFAMEISLLADAGILLNLGLWSDLNKRKTCNWRNQSLMYAWTVNVVENNLVNDHWNCSTSFVHDVSGNKAKRIECHIAVEAAESANYCVVVRLIDERCRKHTLWKPPMNGNTPCTWIKHCAKVFGNSHHEPTGIHMQPSMSNNSYFLLSVIIIASTMFTMLGIMYFACYMRTRKVQVANFYKHNKSKICGLESDDRETVYEDNSIMSKDLVLLYPKGSPSFMALMADFRGILAKVGRCCVYDWYDGTMWNHVAEIGGADWFSDMLHKGSYVIWVDTSVMRSLITSKFKRDTLHGNPECNNFLEISDFRDVVFPVILNLAKRHVQASAARHHRHFVIRLKGFETFDEATDPFRDLPHTRYLIPHDLSQLCSQLSGSNKLIRYTRKEEDLIMQHLSRIKIRVTSFWASLLTSGTIAIGCEVQGSTLLVAIWEDAQN